MDHQPTIFYILENESLGTWWVGKMTITLDEYGMCPYRSISQGELNEKLMNKHTLLNPYLTLVTLNKRYNTCYGVERWLSKLEYKIDKEPERYKELKELLMAGWDDNEIETSTLSVLHVLEHNQPINKIFKKLVTSREGLTRCLNDTKYITYEEKKKDPDFMYKRARKEVLRQMKKTGKLPKPETLMKYEIKEDEIKECMGDQEIEEVTEGRKGIIYKISSPSGKVYVGQTICSFEKRMQQHKSKFSECTLVKRAIDKYGDEMKYEIIENNIPHNQMDEREIHWIKELSSLAPGGYNCDTGGNAYRTASQETKDKISNNKRKSSLDKKGYVGEAIKCGNVFRPRFGNFYLSIGAFHSREEAIEVLKEYTKDPENFSKVEGTYKKPIGHVHKRGNTWQLLYKKKHLGNYATQEEAEEARQTLQSSL